MHAGKAKSPGELINWLTMTAPGALCQAERLKGSRNSETGNRLGPEKVAVSGRQIAGGRRKNKKNNTSAILPVHKLRNTTLCYLELSELQHRNPL